MRYMTSKRYEGSIMRSGFLAITWRQWAILFLRGYWNDFPNCVLRFSNLTLAGYPFGLDGWTYTRMVVTALWASQRIYPCFRASILSANAQRLATVMRAPWRMWSTI